MRTAAGPPCRSTCLRRRTGCCGSSSPRGSTWTYQDDARALVDEGLTMLESNPVGLPAATYDAASDQSSAPIAERGLMLYAVVPEPATVIVLRLIAVRRGNDRGRLAEGSRAGLERGRHDR